MQEAIDAILTSLGISKAAAGSGFFGALLAALKANASRLEKAIYFFVGFGAAIYLPVLLFQWIPSLDPKPTTYGAFGFVFGYFGMSLMDAASETLKSLKGLSWQEIVDSWLKRRP